MPCLKKGFSVCPVTRPVPASALSLRLEKKMKLYALNGNVSATGATKTVSYTCVGGILQRADVIQPPRVPMLYDNQVWLIKLLKLPVLTLLGIFFLLFIRT